MSLDFHVFFYAVDLAPKTPLRIFGSDQGFDNQAAFVSRALSLIQAEFGTQFKELSEH
jgi:hypothetical protein